MSAGNRDRRQRNRDARSAAAGETFRRAKRQRVTLAIVGLGLALVVAIALVTLRRDDGNGSAASNSTSTSSATTTTAAPSVKGKPCVAAKGPYPKKTPEVPVDVGPPPKELIIRDLTQGTGPAVEPGATVSMNYVLVACSSGKIVESSFKDGKPLTVPLDQPGLVVGWSQGIPGMKVGGVRLLGIPPKLGYGPVGNGTEVPPGETLWFVVELEKIGDASAPETTTASPATTTPTT